MRIILLFTFLLIARESHAQVPLGVLNESERGYYQTLTALVDYLRQNKTSKFLSSGTRRKTSETAFYNKVIDTFFEKEQMIREFESDTPVLDRVGQTLKKFDQSLDTLHPASILIEPFRSSSKSVNIEDGFHHSLKVLIRKGDIKIFMLIFFFNEKTNKIVGISSAAHES